MGMTNGRGASSFIGIFPPPIHLRNSTLGCLALKPFRFCHPEFRQLFELLRIRSGRVAEFKRVVLQVVEFPLRIAFELLSRIRT